MSRAGCLVALAFCLTIISRPGWGDPGIDLAWNNCPAGPSSVPTDPFDCNDNVTTHRLVASFIPPAGITQLVAEDATIDILFADGSQPDWWRFGDGECRQGMLTVQATTPGLSGCTQFWDATSLSIYQFTSAYGGDPGRAQLRLAAASPSPGAPVSPDLEYYAFQVMITSRHTTASDPPVCGGCAEPACLVLSRMVLYQPAGIGDFTLQTAAHSNVATWQCGYLTIADPGGIPGCSTAGCPVRTPGTTWGKIRSLYR